MLVKINNNIEVDSLCIRIPCDEVEWYDKEKLGKLISINGFTGEEVSVKNMSYVHLYGSNIRVYFSFVEYELKEKKYKLLQILLSSKILKSAYFSGITNTNIKYIYNKIQSFGIAEFPYRSFYEANVYDVDFKQDSVVEIDGQIYVLKDAMDRAIVSEKRGVGYNYYNDLENEKKDNLGLSFGNEKRFGQKNEDVFLKLYSKKLEVFGRSYAFWMDYFKGKEMPHVLRQEYTVKNASRFQRLGIDKKFTLQNILSLSQEEKITMLSKVNSYHMTPLGTAPKREINKEQSKSKTVMFIETLLLITKKKPVNEQEYYNNLRDNYIFALTHIDSMLEGRKNKDKRTRYKAELETVYFSMKEQKPIEVIDESNVVETLNRFFP